MAQKWVDGFDARALGAAITSTGATAITFATGDGALLPALSGGDFLELVIVEGAAVEEVRLTARSGDTGTITRAQNGTTAQTFTTAATITAPVTAAALGTLRDGIATNAATITSEATTRAAADTTNANAISAETTARTAADALLAPLASPALTGTPTAPTQSPGNNSTRVATTAFVADAVATEATTRAAADAALDARVDVLEAGGGGGGAVSSVFGRTGAVVKSAGDYAVADVTGAAPLASPTFTGTPAAPTASAGTNSTQLATTAFVTGAVATETSARTGADALLAPLASPALTGTPTAPTAAAGTSTTQLATTAFTVGEVATEAAARAAADVLLAPLASPALTGNPTAPTQATGNSSTRLATTAFVAAATGPVTWTSKSASFTLTSADEAVLVDTSGGAVVCTLYDPAGHANGHTIKHGAGSNALTFAGYTVDGASPSVPLLDVIEIKSDGSAWRTVTRHHADAAVTGDLASYAPLASPALTGNPTAPTQTAGNNTTRLATTAFVTGAIGALGTASALNVPASGDAASGEVVKGSDTRLTNSRTPTAHASTHASAGSDPITIAASQIGSGTVSAARGGTGADTSASTANTVLAAPDGSSGAPTMRALVAADIPSLAASKITSGTLAVAQGGTGVATASANTIFAGPSSGGATAPAFRALVSADLSGFNVSKTLGSNVALSASTTINITEFDLTVAAGEKWRISYWVFVTVSAGTAGLKPIFTLPASSTGSRIMQGSTTSATGISIAVDTTPTSAGATGWLTASFTGHIKIEATLVFTNSGTCRIGFTTGASAAGNILADATSMHAVRAN